MAELIAVGPLQGCGAVETAGCTLEPLDLGPMAAILPYPGRAAAVDAALRARGLGLPAPGGSFELADTRILWSGREAALLIGTAPPELPDAAVIDQTDGWAGLSLAGPGAEAVLARLVPIDLRTASFPEGATARTLLSHLPVLILRRAGGFELLVTASHARWAQAAVARALRGVAARDDQPG